MPNSINNCKQDFPIFTAHPQLVYLDSAASSQKPQVVIDAERHFYETSYANVHRGIYGLSQTATEVYEAAREKVRKFINARSTKEIIFVRGATEAINLVAQSYGQHFRAGDVILLSEMEHHANIVPWQALAKLIGVQLRWIPMTASGDLDLSNIDELLTGVKFVAVTQMSNVLGTVNDVETLAAKAHAVGAKILVDGAQSVPHMPVDVRLLDCDFLVFSGHKMLGPTGIGVLYAKQEVLETMEPYQRGGDMILSVTKDTATWNELPYKFEAGTPNIAGAIGLGAAVDYLSELGMENIWQHEQELMRYGLDKLAQFLGVRVLGAALGSLPPASPLGQGGAIGRGAIFAFSIEGIHPHDIGSILDERGIAIRAGHHCAQPLHERLGFVATARASGYVYTTTKDIDALVDGIKNVQETFA
jgi:cysteine desulfurase/selenocysteine lyase